MKLPDAAESLRTLEAANAAQADMVNAFFDMMDLMKAHCAGPTGINAAVAAGYIRGVIGATEKLERKTRLAIAALEKAHRVYEPDRPRDGGGEAAALEKKR